MQKNCLNCELYKKKIKNIKSIEVVYVCHPEMSLGISRERLKNYCCDGWESKSKIPNEVEELFGGIFKGRK